MTKADDARKASTPWRGMSVRPGGSANATRQRKAFKRMSIIELETGMTEAEFDAQMAAQRARVFARYGLDAA